MTQRRTRLIAAWVICALLWLPRARQAQAAGVGGTDSRVEQLLARMTVAEKIGQLTQVNADTSMAPFRRAASSDPAGTVGAVLNAVDVQAVNDLQNVATQQSRLGVPLLVGRDVVHGFKTVLPIPLGQAATWNPVLVRQGARMAALEGGRGQLDLCAHDRHLPRPALG